MTTFILIRHGESQANRQGIFAGHFDVDLQNRGMEQAELTAKYITENFNIDKVYASDLKRAYKTGKCVADLLNIDVVTDRRLREIYAGEWDGKKFDELTTRYKDDYNMWLNDIGNACCTGGEPVRELGDRVMEVLTEIAVKNAGKTIAVATHATPIRVMQTLVQHGGFDKMKDVPWVTNASFSIFEYDNGEWYCREVSHDEHLGELRTSLPKNV